MRTDKDPDNPLYIKETQPVEDAHAANLIHIIARMEEAVNIAVTNSLRTRFDALDSGQSDLQVQINNILDGTTTFGAITLPVGFALDEAQVSFGTTGHDHSGGTAGAQVTHGSIGGVQADDHHAPESGESATHTHDLSSQNNGTSDFQSGAEVATLIATHAGVADAHHAEAHAFGAHTGALDDALITVLDPNLNGGVATTGHVAFGELALGLTTHVASTGNVHGLVLGDIGAAAAVDLTAHTIDSFGHTQVTANASEINDNLLAILDLQDYTGAFTFGVVAPDYSTTNYLTAQTNLTDGDIILDAQIKVAMDTLPLKLNIADLDAALAAYGGSFGSVTPLANLTAVNGVITNLTVTNVGGIASFSGTTLTAVDLIATGTVDFPDASIEQKDVAASSQLETWHVTPGDLVEELNNIRHVISKVTGEPAWELDGANPPDFTTSSQGSGRDLKTLEEEIWYRDWFSSSPTIRGLIVDTFEDSTGLSSGSASDHKIGTGTFFSSIFSYSPTELYSVDYVVLHVEASIPTGVSAEVSCDGGVNWITINNTNFDVAMPVPNSGRDIQVKLVVSSGVVYSYGVLLGRSDLI